VGNFIDRGEGWYDPMWTLSSFGNHRKGELGVDEWDDLVEGMVYKIFISWNLFSKNHKRVREIEAGG
jgi:hypothetical protein